MCSMHLRRFLFLATSLSFLGTTGRAEEQIPQPRKRTSEELSAVLHGTPSPTEAPRPLRLLLVAGPQDHGPGEHDYPAWLSKWSELMTHAPQVDVDTAMNWPTQRQFRNADTIIFYQKGSWTTERADAFDQHLAKGGGLVFIHWAIEGGHDAPEFARRIGLASDEQHTQYRHGPLEVHWESQPQHPIARNLPRLSLVDESYWNLIGDATQLTLLGRGGPERDDIRPPLFWTVERQRGRVFVSIPGHYAWTFDDPIYRVLLLRGTAWVSHEPVDRFNALASHGIQLAAP